MTYHSPSHLSWAWHQYPSLLSKLNIKNGSLCIFSSVGIKASTLDIQWDFLLLSNCFYFFFFFLSYGRYYCFLHSTIWERVFHEKCQQHVIWYQSVVFGGIRILQCKINKRMIFDPGIMFLFEKAYSWHSRTNVLEKRGNGMIFRGQYNLGFSL